LQRVWQGVSPQTPAAELECLPGEPIDVFSR
jgi:hypothetical protein